MNRRTSNIALLSSLMIVISSSALSQETALWSGQAQCQLSVQSPGYVDQEIQTWAITGQPQIQGQLQIYPATWRVTGQGQRQDVQGIQITTMRWNTNVPPMQAPLAIFVNSAKPHYLSLCGGQCLPGANFKDVMQALGLQLGTLAPNPPSVSGCGDVPFCSGWGSAWTDDQAARYTNVTEFENSARVTGCWTIGRPNGRIICYTKTMDHGLQVIVRQTDVSWFLSFAASDPNAEVFDWVTYDGVQLYRIPFDQRLVSAYTLTNGVMLDSEGTKYPPHACLACHGGKVTTSGVTGSTLLPLDPGLLQNFDTSNSRRLNVVAFYASPSAAVARYLTGLYGIDPLVASSTGDPNYVPQGWKQQPEVYNNVIKPYCMMCHLATPSNLDFTIPANFYQNQDLVYTVVCSARSMPHAEAPFKQFWTKDTGPLFLPGYVAALLGHQSCP